MAEQLRRYYHLLTAVLESDEAAVRSLLPHCHDLEAVDEDGRTLLHRACENGHHQIAELLLYHGASVHTAHADTGETALHVAAQSGSEDTVALLLRRGADVLAVDLEGNTVLHAAAHGDCENNIELLLSYNADIEAVNDRGHTPLSWACLVGKPKAANLLIRSGANIHWVGPQSRTLVHEAAGSDLADTIKLLLDLKAADVDAVDERGRTALHVAVCGVSGLNAARCLLRNGANVNCKDWHDGYTALLFAVWRGNLETVELLLKYEADINFEAEDGMTPLTYELVDVIDIKMVECLAKHLVKMKAQNLFISESNLKELSENDKVKNFSASCEDEIERMRNSAIGDSNVTMYDIINEGVNQLEDYVPNDLAETILASKNYKSEFPIYASEIHDKFLQRRERNELLRQSSDWLWTVINEFYEMPYILAKRINRCLTNDDLALQISPEFHSQQRNPHLELKQQASPKRKPFNYSLRFAVQEGDEAAVRSLLPLCRDLEAVDKDGWTVLHHACTKGHHRIAELLLDHGASVHTAEPKYTGEAPLHLAVRSGSEDTVDLLLRRGADVRSVDRAGYTALHDAAAADSDHFCQNIVHLLLSHRADIEATNNQDVTPLSIACTYEAVNLLIKSGANIHRVDTHKRTYVHLAAKRQFEDGVLQLLLDLKAADVDAFDDEGTTALHVACRYSSLNAAKCLLKNGARVNRPCRENGSTALHIAALEDNLELSELLLTYEADINVENKNAQTPLKCALYNEEHLGWDPGRKMSEIFAKLLVKMKTQNLFISESNLKELSENDSLRSFSASCEDETERMSNSAIGDSSVNLYDFIIKDENRLADYLSNEIVERVLESENYKEEFPIYGSEIRKKFLHARERRDLLRQSSERLWTVINEFYELPYMLVEKINRCLTNDDLALQISQEEPLM